MNTKTLIYHPERWRFLRPPQEYNTFLRDNVEAYQDLINDDGDLDLLLPWYEKCGRNIFHLQPGLVELLANSSADDMTFAQLRSPYEALYLHWGRAGNVRTPDGCLFVEGAYVAFEDNNGELNLWVYLTTEYTEIDQARTLPLPERLRRDCRGIDFSVFFAHPMATVKESIEDKFVNPYERMTEEEYDAAEQWLVDANIKEFPEFERAVNKTHAEAKAGWILPEKELLWRESATPAINLVVNALCYLAYDGREVDCRYPDNAPANLVRQALGANRKDAQRASSKLAAVGFRKVHICGESLKTRGQATHTGSAKATHWRRGHWRHQAYGTGWQQRKLVWIMPALVGRDEQPVAGHLYEVVH